VQRADKAPLLALARVERERTKTASVLTAGCSRQIEPPTPPLWIRDAERNTVNPVEFAGVGVVLFAAVVAGTVAHELSHAAVLRALAVPYEVEWLPARSRAGTLRAGLVGGWARVRPRRLSRDCPTWGLRVAALAPFVMTTPLVLVLSGVLPDPARAGNPYLTAAMIGWLACAIPSPQDFSLFWYAERALVQGVTDDGP
jgi:hypothetical protein